MEENIKYSKTNGFNGIYVSENERVLNLKNTDVQAFSESLKLPISLTELYLADNKLLEVPACVLKLPNIKILDVSCNKIQLFDEVPDFCHELEYLDLSKNNLLCPPNWIWAESPRNLRKINLSYNENLTCTFQKCPDYFEELLQYKSQISDVVINNCKLTKYIKLLSTFPKLKCLEFGSSDLNHHSSINKVEEIPDKGLEKCCEIECLNLCNTYLYFIKENIQLFQNLKEINLSQNKLTDIPKEFCYLKNLEICILSLNSILYLPEEFVTLNKLKTLLLDSNELCMLPENISNLDQLKRLDIYDNKLYEIPENLNSILEIDLAQNYFEEPDIDEYKQKKSLLRNSLTSGRLNGSKKELQKEETSDHNSVCDDCELDFEHTSELEDYDNSIRSLSSPEDWDSDEYWIPHFICHTQPAEPPWLYFVRKKIADGNFCPIDAHQVSISERVKYEKLHYPQVVYESDGQFDDYSDDNS